MVEDCEIQHRDIGGCIGKPLLCIQLSGLALSLRKDTPLIFRSVTPELPQDGSKRIHRQGNLTYIVQERDETIILHRFRRRMRIQYRENHARK